MRKKKKKKMEMNKMSQKKFPHTGRPVAMTMNGMIATSHYLATSTGNYVLQQGGSAVDAAIAANAVLCVVYPHMAGLGGDCFWLIWSEKEQQLLALNGSGRSAQKASIDFYRQRGIDDEIPSRGVLAANTVPGALDGWYQAHQKLGKVIWRDLFFHATLYARGVPIPESTATWLEKDRQILEEDEYAKNIFLPNGLVPQKGEILIQNDLANTFELIAEIGPDVFYKGEIAQEITRYLGEQDGLLTMDDFGAHRSEWVEPIKTDYRGVEVATFPPNTQGVAILLILNLLEGMDVKGNKDGTADYIHNIVEATKLAFADRDQWVTDLDTIDIPMEELLSQKYSNERRKKIDSGRVLPEEEASPGMSVKTYGDTIYLSAVDRDRNAVSLIQSIYHDFGSGVVGGNTGVILQNRGSFFSLDPEHVNRLEPGKRTFHTLMPSMMLRNGKPFIVFGTMGGEGQPQTQAMMVTRLLDFGYNVQQAIEAPRWLYGRAWGEQEKTLKIEGRYSGEVADELKRRGHDVEVVEDWAEVMGHAQAIHIDPETSVLSGGADPRGDGAAMGW
jgi:oxamate amidohydrolase